MGGQNLSTILTIALACLLVVAAITDLKSRIISNRLNLVIAALAPLFWYANGLTLWPGVIGQIGVALVVFAVFTAAFTLGFMGGGDVKLLTALALWLPWEPMLFLIIMMSLLGGAVTIVTAIHHRIAHRPGSPEIPYGVAIALAGLWVVGEPYINQFTG